MNNVWDFHGGIHPLENKTQSLSKAIVTAPIAPQLTLPLSQHIGAPAKAIVQVGDYVLKGQCIAEAVGPVSVPLHAPTSGTVIAIEQRTIPHASGLEDNCIVIETNGKDEWRTRNPIADYTQLDKSTLIKIISDAGISGMGGAGFPTSIKLNTRDDTAIDTLILNATECEPYITADHSLMREYADEIASGVAILAKIIKPTKILFGIEDNKLDVVDGITAALAQHDFSVLTGLATEAEVITFPTKYPSGGEKQLIQILTGKEVPSGGLPAQLGIVCQNIGTAVAIHNAVCLDEPLISRITTVTGDAVNQPCNYHTLLGTPVEFLLAQSDYQENQSARLIMGGPMMGFALANTAVPVIKTSNCILAPTEQELPTPPPAQACIRCGMCAEACPASLLPQQLYWFAQGKELDKLEEHNIADCIECGACSYVCPSNIPLVQYYRASKVDIKQRKVDHQNAELAKERFDARQERLQRLEDEKIAARQARQAAAKLAAEKRGKEDVKRAAVEAAVERVKAKKAKSVQEFTDSPETQKTKEAKEKESQANIIATESDDPIARAVAKRAAQQAEDAANPENKLIRAIDSAEQRISKSQSRVIDAEANNDENLAIFKQAVEKAEAKLASAQQALIDFRAQNSAQE